MAAKPSKRAKTKPAAAQDHDVAQPAKQSLAPELAQADVGPRITVVAPSDDTSDLHSPATSTAPSPAPSIAPKGESMKMKDLVDAVMAKTGAKKKDTKEVIDAVLGEFARALQDGKSLNLPPLGNLRIAKIQDRGEVKMMVLKLRMGGGAGKNSGADTLADDDEDS